MKTIVSCLLYVSTWDRAAQGLLGAAERLSQELQLPHIVVAIGVADAVLDQVAQHADRVINVRHNCLQQGYQMDDCLALLTEVCRPLAPKLVLLGQDTYSQEITPRLAFRLGGAAVGDVQKIESEHGKIRVTRGVYGGKAQAVFQINADPAVVRLRARAFAPPAARATGASIEQQEVELPANQNAGRKNARLVSREQVDDAKVRLEDARFIVSGGRGLGGPEPFDELRQLATAMKAELAASRAACDAGWVPAGLQVGQTGKKVAPQLYLAIAISGASQHLMGIADAKTVAAINTDPDAPIFRHCKFGLVDDYRNVVGPLRDLIAKKLS